MSSTPYLPCQIHPQNRHHQQPNHLHTWEHYHLPLQRLPKPLLENHDPAATRVPPPFPPTRLAKRISQGTLLWPSGAKQPVSLQTDQTNITNRTYTASRWQNKKRRLTSYPSRPKTDLKQALPPLLYRVLGCYLLTSTQMEGSSLTISQTLQHIHLLLTQRTNPPCFALTEYSVLATEKASLLPPQTTLHHTADNYHNPNITTVSILPVHLTPKTTNNLNTITTTQP